MVGKTELAPKAYVNNQLLSEVAKAGLSRDAKVYEIEAKAAWAGDDRTQSESASTMCSF